jgi:hypothetical protein
LYSYRVEELIRLNQDFGEDEEEREFYVDKCIRVAVLPKIFSTMSKQEIPRAHEAHPSIPIELK